MASLQDIFSLYIKVVMMGIGLYMVFVQSKYLHTVDHLEKEAKFTKVVGSIYIIAVIFVSIVLAYKS